MTESEIKVREDNVVEFKYFVKHHTNIDENLKKEVMQEFNNCFEYNEFKTLFSPYKSEIVSYLMGIGSMLIIFLLAGV